MGFHSFDAGGKKSVGIRLETKSERGRGARGEGEEVCAGLGMIVIALL
jgi:hypothetical protein